MVGKYKIQQKAGSEHEFLETAPGFGVTIEVHDPRNSKILSRAYGADSRFTFTANNAGEHTICLTPNVDEDEDPSVVFRVHLKLQTGQTQDEYLEEAKREELTALQLKARQLLDQAKQIQKEQNFQRFREQRFRYTSESTNAKVFWWAAIQILVLTTAGFLQIQHLKSFFQSKKIV